MLTFSRKWLLIRTKALFLIIFLVSCNFPGYKDGSSNGPDLPAANELQQTEVTFNVSIAQPLPAGDSIYLNLLDEVTGLSFNLHKYIMQADNAQSYSVTLPFTIGKVIKYRYSREGAAIVNQHLYNNRPVRYGLYDVEGPGDSAGRDQPLDRHPIPGSHRAHHG